MRKVPILSSMLWLPRSAVRVGALKEALTIRVWGPGQDEAYEETIAEQDGPSIVRMWSERKAGYIGVPRQWGLAAFPGLRYIDCTVKAVPRPDLFPQGIRPRDDKQRDFMADLADVCKEDGVIDYVANASTGSGKTVSDLWLTARLGVPTLVICHITKIARQWQERVRQYYGEAWAERYLGHVQQDTCDYRGRLIVTALLPSLARRDYGADFYRYFPKVTVDEVHKAGSPLLSEALKLFPAAIRGGYTATNRRDGLKRVVDYHLGKPRVVSRQQVPRSTVWIHAYREDKALNDFSEYTLITGITHLSNRNRLIRDIICDGYRRDRQILVLSDRTLQLQQLAGLCEAAGVPGAEIGLHVGSYHTGRYVGYVRVDGRRRRIGVFDGRRRAFGMGAEEVTPEKVTTKPAELDEMARRCRILFATYGIFDTGSDIPRLDMGVEASPRADVTQALGRILRPLPGKPVPEWHAIEDTIRFQPYRDRTDGLVPPPWDVYDYFTKKSISRRLSYARQRAAVREIS